MGKNIVKNASENLSSTYSRKHLDHGKRSATYTVKTASKNQFKKQQK